MRPFREARVTIIGLGFLMEYIFPCFRRAMGEKTGEQVNAVTADERDLEGKRARLGIPVFLNDNAKALRALEPDYIFFAPPPTVAPALTEECLVPYFKELRAAGKPVPALVAFPPSPKGDYYLEQLGEDLRVVNIIPNMISTVGDEMVPNEACHLITYPHGDNWTDAEKAELADFLSPMGRRLELTPEITLHVLSAEIATHPLTELCDVAARELTERGISCSYQEVASCLRAAHQRDRSYTAPGTNDCSLGAIKDTGAAQLLGQVSRAWYSGLHKYLTDQGFPPERAAGLLDPLFDLYFHEAQLESRETIVVKAKKDATAGGMLELCMERYHDVVAPRLASLFAEAWPAKPAAVEEIGELMALVTGAVVERGSGLTAVKVPAFSPRQHAVLFGVLAKGILTAFGREEGDKLLWEAVSQYGEERGRRMALRCAADGERPDMAAYFAYGEWRATEGFCKTPPMGEDYLHYHVLQCPWCTVWDETGLSAYGQYYCRTVDQSILRGFHPALTLDMPEYHSAAGADFCDFHWKDAAMDDIREARQSELSAKVGVSCVKDFTYHTAHLYQTLVRRAAVWDGEKGREAEKRARGEFVSLCSHQELLKVLALTEGDFTMP